MVGFYVLWACTCHIREEKYYICGYEVFRRFVGNSFEAEHKSLNLYSIKKKEEEKNEEKRNITGLDAVFDNNQRFALIEYYSDFGVTVVRYQYSNHLGSACLELDENGDIISYEEYHPFGTTSYRSGRNDIEVSLKRYKYNGKEKDEETGGEKFSIIFLHK